MGRFIKTCCFSLNKVVAIDAASILCFPFYPIAKPSMCGPQIALLADD
jgi:hypothetical protein